MSLLLSPPLLFFAGMLVARLAKGRRVWRRHSLFTLRASILVLLLYTALELSLLLDLPWAHGLALSLGAPTGTDWVVNSGLLHLDVTWPLADPFVVGFVVVSFMLFPAWLYLGVISSHWLFGRSPKQTGILGLLR